MKNKKTAFTLIELLVVIVIIEVLSAIGIASFDSFNDKATDARRQMTIRDIANLIKLDREGWPPIAPTIVSGSPQNAGYAL